MARGQGMVARLARLEQQVRELYVLANKPVDVTEAMNDILGGQLRETVRQTIEAVLQARIKSIVVSREPEKRKRKR